MNKRIIALLLCCLLILPFSACRQETAGDLSSANANTTGTNENQSATDTRENTDGTSAIVSATDGEPTTDTTATATTSTVEVAEIEEATVVVPAIVATETSTDSNKSEEAIDYGDHEIVEMDTVEEIEIPQINGEIQTNSVHVALSESAYYQYSFLSNTEKSVYKALVSAIKNGDTIVDMSDYGCSVDAASDVFGAVISDYPQFFYLSKSFGYTSSTRKNTIKQFIIIYFDGENADQYNSKGKLTVTADRTLINQQIQSFNNKVSEIISSIPSDVSSFEKEKLIYEYLQDTIVYDSDAAASVTSASNISCHAFDAYGAACENLAVCEGYAELFQYLCYCVNINATPVYGTAYNVGHMWNAVLLDSEWYMVDVTWDDAAKDGLHCYGYFNITESVISTDHTIDYETIRVPSCTATTYAFYNWYALYVSSSSEDPTNYENVIDYLAKGSEKYLCVYVGNISKGKRKYIQQYILSSKSRLQQYISSMEYSISFDSIYYTIGNYCYIPL